MIKPFGHGERQSGKVHYKVVSLDRFPGLTNSMTIMWHVSFWDRIRLVFGGKIKTSFRVCDVPQMRVDI